MISNNDVRDDQSDSSDLFDLIQQFQKTKAGYQLPILLHFKRNSQ